MVTPVFLPGAEELIGKDNMQMGQATFLWREKAAQEFEELVAIIENALDPAQGLG